MKPLDIIRNAKEADPQEFYKAVYDAADKAFPGRRFPEFRIAVTSMAALLRQEELGQLEMTRVGVFKRFKKLVKEYEELGQELKEEGIGG